MNFNIQKQKEFFINYAIKNHTIPDEYSINLFGVRLKKEFNHLYNIFQLINDNPPLNWERTTQYEAGEIVHHDNINYKCLQTNINQQPDTSPEFWVTTYAEEYTKNPFSNYIAKDDQTPYDPLDLKENEETNNWHPTNVKHVEDRLTYWFNNETVANADRLDGEHKEYFCSKEEFLDFVNIALTQSNVVDNLTSDSRTSPLSAYQGKVIKTMIDKINDILTSDNINLDELQEIVNWIEANRDMINSLGIDNIKGLRDYLNNIDLELEKRVTLDYWNNNFLSKLKAVDGSGSGVDADLLDGKDSTYFLPASKFNATEISKLLQTIPGAVGKIDADKLDGLHASDFLRRTTSSSPSKDSSFNLGEPAKKWNNIYANNFIGTALKAKYADLAEKYDLNVEIDYGFVIGYSRENKIYRKYQRGDIYIGIVSENPGFILNNESRGIPLVLKGKTPAKCISNIYCGDYILPDLDNPGYVIGVKDYNFEESKKLVGIAISDSNDGKVIIKV